MKKMLRLAVMFMVNFLKTDADFRWFLTKDGYVTVNGIDFDIKEDDYGTLTIEFSDNYGKWISVEFEVENNGKPCPMRVEYYDKTVDEVIIENPYEIEAMLKSRLY